MYVCSCRGVTDHELQSAIDAGAKTIDEVSRTCGAGGGCGGCHRLLERLLAELECCGVLDHSSGSAVHAHSGI